MPYYDAWHLKGVKNVLEQVGREQAKNKLNPFGKEKAKESMQ